MIVELEKQIHLQYDSAGSKKSDAWTEGTCDDQSQIHAWTLRILTSARITTARASSRHVVLLNIVDVFDLDVLHCWSSGTGMGESTEQIDVDRDRLDASCVLCTGRDAAKFYSKRK